MKDNNETEKDTKHQDDDDKNVDIGVPNDPNVSSPTISTGPNFHVNQRVLVADAVVGDDVFSSDDERPLYEAIIRKSGMLRRSNNYGCMSACAFCVLLHI